MKYVYVCSPSNRCLLVWLPLLCLCFRVSSCRQPLLKMRTIGLVEATLLVEALHLHDGRRKRLLAVLALYPGVAQRLLSAEAILR